MTSQVAKQNFDRDGFVAIRSFLNPLEVQQIQDRIDEYVNSIVPYLAKNQAYYEDKTRLETLKQLQDISRHDVFFGRMFVNDKFVSLAELLLDGPVRMGNFQWFNKPPRLGQATPAHQDGFYFMLDPNEAITMWLALDPVDEDNGCVRYIAGSHRNGVRPHGRTGTLGFSQGITNYDDQDRTAEIAIHAQPGDLLVHHSLTIHRADNNQSDRPRRALGLQYFARRAREDTERQEAYQKSLTAELTAAKKL